MSDSERKDGRGQSEGSRGSRFSSSNQPDRSKKKKRKKITDSVEVLRASIYEKIPFSRHGKNVEIPFIEAFILSMRKNAFSAKISEQLKFFIQLKNLGLFDIQVYKEKISNWFYSRYDSLAIKHNQLIDLYEHQEKMLDKQFNSTMAFFYENHKKFNIIYCALMTCKCGGIQQAMEEGLSLYESDMKEIREVERAAANLDEPEFCDELADSFDDDEPSAVSPEDVDPDDDLQSGMIEN